MKNGFGAETKSWHGKKSCFPQWFMGQIIMVMGMESERSGWIHLKDRIDRTCYRLYMRALKEEAKFLRCYLLTKFSVKEKKW